MIRLPATTIILGRSDLLDYEKRKRTRGREKERVSETDKLNEQLARFTVRSQPGSGDSGYGNTNQALVQHNKDNREEAAAIESSEASNEYEAESPSHEITFSPEDLLSEEEYGYVSVGFEHSPENATHETPRPTSPSKQHDFYYGGFIETASSDLMDDPPETPDASTPQHLQLPSSNRLRSRNQLPRSPLYVSQNASSSPERRPTASLTPRVASRVANHNTPGIIFSQPARRPPRITTLTGPRTFRHQTNSFSFDSSERSSAAYEQERTVSSSTEGRAQNADNVNLHEDLRGSSLQSSRVGSVASYKISATPEIVGEGESVILPMDEEDGGDEQISRHVGFSPQLSLPPPFSTVSRSVSRANSLPYPPAREYIAGNPPISPISPSSTPNRGQEEERRHSSPAPAAEHEPLESNSPSGSRFNPVTFVNRALSIYRTRSPFSRQSSPQSAASSASATPRQDQSRQLSANLEPITPSRGYQVYNDAVSPDLQPQTPAHLPESRHQSRYHPSYTAPVTRAAARRGLSIDDGDGEGLQQSLPRQRHAPIYTPLRGGRSASPIGLMQGGFQGLYGGRENGDEEQSWVEGVRFNNAETRLWGSRDDQNNGGSLRRTPEPDEWRVGRRN